MEKKIIFRANGELATSGIHLYMNTDVEDYDFIVNVTLKETDDNGYQARYESRLPRWECISFDTAKDYYNFASLMEEYNVLISVPGKFEYGKRYRMEFSGIVYGSVCIDLVSAG